MAWRHDLEELIVKKTSSPAMSTPLRACVVPIADETLPSPPSAGGCRACDIGKFVFLLANNTSRP
jgi:hypothetical protein